jgi:hypothetical protein
MLCKNFQTGTVVLCRDQSNDFLDCVGAFLKRPMECTGCEARRVGYGAAVKYWEIIAADRRPENLRNAGWNCGSIATTDGKGRTIWLWPQSVAMLDALLCMQIKSCLPFSNSNPQFKRTGIIMTLLNRATKPMKDWEIIADRLSKAGWSYGYVSAIDREGRTIWIADAHRDGKRFIVRADEKLTAFVELERAIHEVAVMEKGRGAVITFIPRGP